VRGFRMILLILMLATVAGLVAGAWLIADQPQPREAERWSLGPSLPAPRGELATAVGYARPCPTPPCADSERLFVLGGLSGFFNPQSRVEVFDPIRNTWSVGPELPAARHHLAAAQLGDEVYVSGGTDIAGAHLGHQFWPPHNNFWRLSPGADTWQILPPMIEPRWGHRMVAYDGRLFVIGGRGPSGRVLIYTPGKNWSLGAAMPSVRDHLSVVEVGGKLWAIGGRDPNSIARVDIYDPVIDTWVSGPELPHATSGAAEVVVDGTIYVFGGEEPDFFSGEVKDRHWSLDTHSDPPRWEPAPRPPLAVHGSNAVALGDNIAIAGGATRHGAFSAVAWTNALQLYIPEGRRSASHK
jgi:N-acetylneuraminic acid mutarotase